MRASVDFNPSHKLVGRLIKYPELVKSAKEYLEGGNYLGPDVYMYSKPQDGDYVKCAIVAGWDYSAEISTIVEGLKAECAERKAAFEAKWGKPA